MKEDIIDQLFEQARTEAPDISVEQVCASFQTATAVSPWSTVTSWINKHISMNTLIIFTMSALLLYTLTEQAEHPKDKTTRIFIDSVGQVSEDSQIDSFRSQRPIVDDSVPQNFPQRPDPNVPKMKEVENQTVDREAQPPIAIQRLDSQVSPTGQALISESSESEPERDIPITLPLSPPLDSLPVKPISKEKESNHSLVKDCEEQNGCRILTLRLTDDENAVDNFIAALEATGLNISMKTDYNRSPTYIQSFLIRFKHRKGLNFRLRANGFKKLDLILFVDEAGQIEYFQYRINDKAFTHKIHLNARGHQKYILGDGYSGRTGLTNVPIHK